MKNRSPLILGLLVVSFSQHTHAADGTWSVDANGTWSTPGNWLSDIADGSGSTASFTNDITGDRTVSLDGDRTLTNLVFGDSDTETAGSWILNNNSVSTNNLILAGTTPTITVNALGTAKTATISAIIQGSAGLVKAGAGTLVLSGVNTFTGGTTINNGTISISADTRLGATSSGITLNGGTLNVSSSVSTSSSRSLTVGSNGGTISTSGSGNVNLTFNGAVSGAGNTLTVNGNENGNRVQHFKGAFDVGTLILGNSVTGVGLLTSATVSNSISIGTGQILQLNGVSETSAAVGSYSGIGVTLNGGILRNRFGVNTLTMAINLAASGTIGNRTTTESLTFSGNIASTAGSSVQTLTFGEASTSSNAGTITQDAASVISDGVSGGKVAIVGNMSGTSGQVILNGANTHTGMTKVSAGILTLSNSLALQNSAFDTTSVAGSTTAGLKTAVTTLTFGGLTGGNALAGRFMTTGGGYDTVTALTLNPQIGSVSYSGAIADGAAGMTLTKTGAGTQELSGTNTYTGATAVNGGTLVINGDQSAATGDVTVNNAGTRLKGTGTIGGDTTINAGAIHSVGTSVGIQTFDESGAPTTNLTYAEGSIFEWELGATLKDFDTSGVRGTDWDAVNVSGTLGTTGDGAIFRVVLDDDTSFADTFWTENRKWTDIFKTSDGGSAVNFASIFSGFQHYNYGGVDGALMDLGGVSSYGTFTITGSTLNWTAVPEPTSALAGLLLGAGLLRRRRQH